MKIKLTVLIYTAMLLVGLLTGCSTETAEPVAEEETQPVITTEPTTEPTEPQTFFEERGLILWEGFNSGIVQGEEGEKITFGMTDSFEGMQIHFSKTQNYEEALWKKNVPTSVMVNIKEYASDQFNSKTLSEVIRKFYQVDKAENSDLTIDEWIAEHENYKVVEAFTAFEGATAGIIDDFFSVYSGRHYWTCFYGTYAIMDRKGGTVFSEKNPTHNVGKFDLEVDGETIELMMLQELYFDWTDSATSNYQDCQLVQSAFVLVPETYHDLAFILAEFTGELADEESKEVANRKGSEEDGWYTETLDEFEEEDDISKSYYLAMLEE